MFDKSVAQVQHASAMGTLIIIGIAAASSAIQKSYKSISV
jgi:hypothetical protein